MGSSWNMNPRRLCTAAMAVSSASAWSFTAPSQLDAAIAGRNGTLVAFVLPELASCKKFKSHWEFVQQVEPAAAVVDCSKEAEYCLSQDVRTHPAVRAYSSDRSFTRHRGPRETDDILSFFQRTHRPVVTTNPSPNFTTSDDLTVLAYLPPKTPDNALLHEQFEDVAGKYRDRYSFGLQIVEDGVEVGLGCWNNANGMEYGIRDLSKVGSMEGFVRGCAVPLVRELTSRSELQIAETRKSIVTYLPTTPADKKSYINSIRPLAKRYAEYLVFVTASTEEYPDVAASIGHQAGSLGVLAIRNTHTGEVFPMREGRVDAEGVDGFIQAVSRGEAVAWDGTPVLKGEPESEADVSEEKPKGGQPADEEQTGGEQKQSHDEL